MIDHIVRVHPSSARLPRERQLAWAMAEFGSGDVPLESDAAAMVRCRIIDNASVALAAINRAPVAAARAQALSHPHCVGATLFALGCSTRVHAEWAAWANAVAVRELDFHDTFLSVEFGHPGDCIAPLIAVAQQCGCDGETLTRGILVAYEVHVALMKSINLHVHKKDHLAHLAPAKRAFGGRLSTLHSGEIRTINPSTSVDFVLSDAESGPGIFDFDKPL